MHTMHCLATETQCIVHYMVAIVYMWQINENCTILMQSLKPMSAEASSSTEQLQLNKEDSGLQCLYIYTMHAWFTLYLLLLLEH